LLGGSLPGLLQVRARQDGRVACACLVDVDVLGFSGDQLLDGGAVQRGGARPLALRVRLHLRKRVLDLLAVLCVAFFLPLGAGAGVDMGEVFRCLKRYAAREIYRVLIHSVSESRAA
jgi:hypothetical protein